MVRASKRLPKTGSLLVRCTAAGLVLLLMAPGLGLTAAGSDGGPGFADEGDRPVTACRSHKPILIQDDEGPLGVVLGTHPVTGAPIYRPGSGVVGGLGTVDDPFRIEGWCIMSGVTPFVAGISITGTTQHLVISANTFDRGAAGVLLENTRNVAVQDNRFEGSTNGIEMVASSLALVEGNTFSGHAEGVSCIRSAAIAVRENHFQGIHHAHVALHQCRLVDIHKNNFVGRLPREFIAERGVRVESSDFVQVVDNHLSFLPLGIEVHASLGGVVSDNVFTSNWNDLLLAESRDQRLDGNTMESGILLYGSSLPAMRHEIAPSNSVRGAPVHYLYNASHVTVPPGSGQILVVGGHNVTVRDQGIHDVPAAIQLRSTDHVTIRHNDLTGVSGISATNITRSEIHDNTGGNIFLVQSSHNLIRNNDLAGPGSSIQLLLSDDNEIQRNHLSGAGMAAVLVIASERTLVHHNDIWGNGDSGIWATGVESSGGSVDARHNWWGCPDGPTHPDCDDVSDGVLYAPWADAPIPDAGRRVA